MDDPVLRSNLGGSYLNTPASDRRSCDEKRKANSQRDAELTTRHRLNLIVD